MAIRNESNRGRGLAAAVGGVGVIIFIGLVILVPILVYSICMVDVPSKHMVIRIRKTGKDLPNDQEIAPSEEYKGVQKSVLADGRDFFNPWTWSWIIVPQPTIPEGKIGVRIRMYGDDLPAAEFIAWKETDKGIVPDVLMPGLYPINAIVIDKSNANSQATEPSSRQNYAERIELYNLVDIPAGFVGVLTNLAGPLPKNSNTILVEKGERGVQPQVLGPGQRGVNPYLERIDLVDCRSQRLNLSEDGDMGFPSKDGFWVTLDGVIEFRVIPEQAATVLVLYNELSNDEQQSAHTASIDAEIIKKIILPNARSFCRLKGSDHSGKDFISGDTRTQFQMDFQKAMEDACDSQGVEIIQAVITKINPPDQIADPVRKRQIALQEELRFRREIKQQTSEQQLAIEKEMVARKQALVAAEQQVVKMTTEAMQKQEIALIDAEQRENVAEFELKAARDMADATLSRGEADAKVIEFANQAEAAGWKKAIAAFHGKGGDYARWVMLKKLAPAFRQMMINTADSPIMDIFKQYREPEPANGLRTVTADDLK